nr:hypothetical protein [Syntrophorhabdus aromaticivorans]
MEQQIEKTDNAGMSTSPSGENFPLPGPVDYERENERLRQLEAEQRAFGREFVVVMGIGFVGAVMAGVVADSVDRATGKPGKFVLGMQRPSPPLLLEDPLPEPGHCSGRVGGPRCSAHDRPVRE